MDELTRRVVSYQQSGEGFADLVRDLAAATYQFPLRNRRCTEDDCGEFLLFVAARIGGMVQRYDFRGVAFEAYLHTNLKWLLRTYLKRRDRRIREARLAYRSALWHDTNSEVVDVGPLYDRGPATSATECRDSGLPPSARRALPFGPWFNRAQTGGHSQRRVMIIALKACLYLSESDIAMVSHLTGFEREWLRECWLRLRVRLNCRRHRYDIFRMRRNRLFVRLQSFGDRLYACCDDTERLRLLQEMALMRQRLARLRLKISRIPRCPTNQEIAEVTGIPKGTIDSALYYAKRKLFPAQKPGGEHASHRRGGGKDQLPDERLV